MRRLVADLSLGAALLAAAVPAAAHHGTLISYDRDKQWTREATVTSFHYANPHPQLFFDVVDDKGNAEHWSAEMLSNPSALLRLGWTKARSRRSAGGWQENQRDDRAVAGRRPGGARAQDHRPAGRGSRVRHRAAIRSRPMPTPRNPDGARVRLRCVALRIVVAASAACCAVGGSRSAAARRADVGTGLSAGLRSRACPSMPKDIAGIWTPNVVGFGGGGRCRDCGDRGFSLEFPVFTPAGQAAFDANTPSYGRALGSADAQAHPEEHIGRRRAQPPALGNDLYQQCNPMGIPRAILYPDPEELIVLPDRILQHFQWGYGLRTIWMDGRQLPKPDEIDLAALVGLRRRALGRATRSSSRRRATTSAPGSITSAIRTAIEWCWRSATRGSTTTRSSSR